MDLMNPDIYVFPRDDMHNMIHSRFNFDTPSEYEQKETTHTKVEKEIKTWILAQKIMYEAVLQQRTRNTLSMHNLLKRKLTFGLGGVCKAISKEWALFLDSSTTLFNFR